MPGGTRPALVWRSLPLRLALAAIPAWLTIAILVFAVPVSIKLIIGVVLVVSFTSPAAGLLAVAALAPLGQILSELVGVSGFRISEAVVLAFVTGWLLRAPADRPGPRVASTIGSLLAGAVAASVCGLAWQLGRYPGELPQTGRLLFYAYYLIGDRIGLVDGARLVEGLALTAATVTLFRQRPQLAVTLPVMLALSATVAAASSVLLWWGIAPAAILRRYALIGYRVSGSVADVNAAGSYFAMMLCLAVGMSVRASGRRRALWVAASAAIAIGLWFSESRSAFGATGMALSVAALWFLSVRWKAPWRTVTLAVVVIGALGLGAAQVRRLTADPDYRGAGFRQQFNATSIRMIAARPLFGVGIGQYYRTSALFLSPQLAWSYGYENAHNYFLQLGAELGLLGLGLFALWIGAGLARAARAVTLSPRDARELGVAAGIAAFLGTCLTGHPLLVGEVAYPFWIQFGLMSGLAGSTLLNQTWVSAPNPRPVRSPKARSRAVAVMSVVIVLAVPTSALRQDIQPPESQAVDGFYEWQVGADGVRFRWSGAYASVFVPADVTRVSIPVRMPGNIRGLPPLGVDVTGGVAKKQRAMVGDSWATIDVALPDAAPPTRFKRVNLRVDRTWQPAIYIAGSADLRSVGVQVGACELVRQH
jgi:O-antigen ligase